PRPFVGQPFPWTSDYSHARTARRTRPPPRPGRTPVVAAVGSVPRGPAVGDGARGLLAGRRPVGVLPVRARAPPRVPLGRGRTRGRLRRRPAAVSGAGAVERPRFHPEGAPVRPRQR